MIRCVRTTLSLDEDVAAQLEDLCGREKLSFHEAVNSTLRRGLRELLKPKARKPFRTEPIDMGECQLASLKNVWDVLDQVEVEGRVRK